MRALKSADQNRGCEFGSFKIDGRDASSTSKFRKGISRALLQMRMNLIPGSAVQLALRTCIESITLIICGPGTSLVMFLRLLCTTASRLDSRARWVRVAWLLATPAPQLCV